MSEKLRLPPQLIPNDDILRTFFYGDMFSQEMCERVLAAHWDPQRTQAYLDLQLHYLPGFANYKPTSLQALGQDEENLWIRHRLSHLLKRVNQRHYRFEASHLSEVQLFTLKAGEKIDWYNNIGTGPFALRKLCGFVILTPSSEYEGGQIYSLVGTADQKQGNLVVSPSIASLCVQEVTRGEMQFLFTTLDGDRPFR